MCLMYLVYKLSIPQISAFLRQQLAGEIGQQRPAWRGEDPMGEMVWPRNSSSFMQKLKFFRAKTQKAQMTAVLGMSLH